MEPNATIVNSDELVINPSVSIDDIPDVDELVEHAKAYSQLIMSYMEKLSVLTGISTEMMMKYALILIMALTLFGAIKDMSTNLVGVLYPLLKSVECLESDNESNDRLWLTYWVCFACFLIFDALAGRFLLGKIVPFYYFIKIGFLVFLFHPQTLGAKTVYANLLHPLLAGNSL